MQRMHATWLGGSQPSLWLFGLLVFSGLVVELFSGGSEGSPGG